eukprot:364018-Chlamydomonas_euryale.AAC.6
MERFLQARSRYALTLHDNRALSLGGASSHTGQCQSGFACLRASFSIHACRRARDLYVLKKHEKLSKLRSATPAVLFHVQFRDQKPYGRDTGVGCRSRRAPPACGLGRQQARPRIQCNARAQGSFCR